MTAALLSRVRLHLVCEMNHTCERSVVGSVVRRSRRLAAMERSCMLLSTHCCITCSAVAHWSVRSAFLMLAWDTVIGLRARLVVIWALASSRRVQCSWWFARLNLRNSLCLWSLRVARRIRTVMGRVIAVRRWVTSGSMLRLRLARRASLRWLWASCSLLDWLRSDLRAHICLLKVYLNCLSCCTAAIFLELIARCWGLVLREISLIQILQHLLLRLCMLLMGIGLLVLY